MVEEARLESVYTPKGYHEFESRSLRNNERIPVMHTGITGIFIAQLIYSLLIPTPFRFPLLIVLCVRKSYLLIAVNGEFLLIEKKNSGYDLLSLYLLVFCTPLRSVMSTGKVFAVYRKGGDKNSLFFYEFTRIECSKCWLRVFSLCESEFRECL